MRGHEGLAHGCVSTAADSAAVNDCGAPIARSSSMHRLPGLCLGDDGQGRPSH